MFKAVESLSALPGACYFCGSGSKGKYIDCGTSIEFYGALYICWECIFSMSKLLGFLSPQEVEGLVEANSKLAEENVSFEIEKAALAEAIRNLAVANFGHTDIMVVQEIDGNTYRRRGFPDSRSNIESVLSDDSEESDGESQISGNELVTGEKGTSKSDSDEGMEFVRSGLSGTGEFKFSL